ncbi:hypothetical protein VZ94_09045 [Methylocucumis oryzae]|uniref:Diguanylate cyclase n=2 Tax=Methylocucumis oryzae TaxID=1632867 RepID=A0A0F3IJU7_9GAMM|nr:hypothetical protein VZ94_09045 [Methylocucumis oryzae]
MAYLLNFSWDKTLKQSLKSVLWPVILFVLFDCGAFAMNYVISNRLSAYAISINLAGRQRMLTQRMAKAVLLADTEIGQPKQLALKELAETIRLFERTLLAFYQGGTTLDGDYKPITLSASNESNIQALILPALIMWKDLKPDVDMLLTWRDKPLTTTQLRHVRNRLVAANRELLQKMDAMTSTLEQAAIANATQLRLYQRLFLIIAFINFIIIFTRLRSNIRHSIQNNATMRAIFNSIDSCILLYDKTGLIISANQAAIVLFGELKFDSTYIHDVLLSSELQMMGVTSSGHRFKAKVNHFQVVQDDQVINICTVQDVSEQHDKEQTLTRLAFHDALTGLPNRLLFYERLEHDLLHAKRNQHLLAVLFLDLDGFKQINDSLGHETGDQVLKMVAERLRSCCREDDTVARLGGDEFTMILASVQAMHNIDLVANVILKELGKGYVLNNQNLVISVSIGIALYPNDHIDASVLIKLADAAMYKAKMAGKNNYCKASELSYSVPP